MEQVRHTGDDGDEPMPPHDDSASDATGDPPNDLESRLIRMETTLAALAQILDEWRGFGPQERRATPPITTASTLAAAAAQVAALAPTPTVAATRAAAPTPASTFEQVPAAAAVAEQATHAAAAQVAAPTSPAEASPQPAAPLPLAVAEPEAQPTDAAGGHLLPGRPLGWYVMPERDAAYWNGRWWVDADGFPTDVTYLQDRGAVPYTEPSTAAAAASAATAAAAAAAEGQSSSTPDRLHAAVTDARRRQLRSALGSPESPSAPNGGLPAQRPPRHWNLQGLLLIVGGVLLAAALVGFAYFAYEGLPLPLQWALLLLGTAAAGAGALLLRRRSPAASEVFATLAMVAAVITLAAAPGKQVLPGDWSPVGQPLRPYLPTAALALVWALWWMGRRFEVRAWPILTGFSSAVWLAWASYGFCCYLNASFPVSQAVLVAPLIALLLCTVVASRGWWRRQEAPSLVLGSLLTTHAGALAIMWVLAMPKLGHIPPGWTRFATASQITDAQTVLAVITVLAAIGMWWAARKARAGVDAVAEAEAAAAAAAETDRLTTSWRIGVVTVTTIAWAAAVLSIAAMIATDHPSISLSASRGASWLVLALASLPLVLGVWLMLRRQFSPSTVMWCSAPVWAWLFSPVYAGTLLGNEGIAVPGLVLAMVGVTVFAAGLSKPTSRAPLWIGWIMFAIGSGLAIGRINFTYVTLVAVTALFVGWIDARHCLASDERAIRSHVWATLPIVGWGLLVWVVPPSPLADSWTGTMVFAGLVVLLGAAFVWFGVARRLGGFILGGTAPAVMYSAGMLLSFDWSGVPVWAFLLVGGAAILAVGLKLDLLSRKLTDGRSFLSTCH